MSDGNQFKTTVLTDDQEAARTAADQFPVTGDAVKVAANTLAGVMRAKGDDAPSIMKEASDICQKIIQAADDASDHANAALGLSATQGSSAPGFGSGSNGGSGHQE